MVDVLIGIVVGVLVDLLAAFFLLIIFNFVGIPMLAELGYWNLFFLNMAAGVMFASAFVVHGLGDW